MTINTNSWNKIRYSIYAPGYDIAARILDNSRKKSIKELNIQSENNILIIGCGTGLDLEFLPKGCHITATDITPKMIQRTEKRNKQLGHHLNTKIMDGQNIEIDDNTFDFVLLHLIISVIPKPILCIKEAERVLKKGGQISVFDKFRKPGTDLSFKRKAANLFTNTFFSDITRSFEEIKSHTQLELISDHKANLNGNFRIIQLQKNV